MHPKVLLLHGIWNATPALWPLARRLRMQGWQVELFGYASVFGSGDAAMTRLHARLAHMGENLCVIGHSLGGLLALETLRRAPELLPVAGVARVVCLGSPLLGSSAAQSLARHRWSAWALGGSAALLQSGVAAWPSRVQVGMVAGNLPRGIGSLLTGLPAPSDGTVRVAETCLPGLADHCTVRASHSGLLLSAHAARQSVYFLQHGCFAA